MQFGHDQAKLNDAIYMAQVGWNHIQHQNLDHNHQKDKNTFKHYTTCSYITTLTLMDPMDINA